ncbi:hypothetical protein, partial [Vibrio sp. 10N.261.52.A1]|uniref:hypothetical protein n=2 Tax=Vibrio TaxID=662 RepID=UPI001A7E18D4
FYVLKRLIYSKPMSQLKNRTALCPVLYGSKSHERIRGLLNFETTGYQKNNGYTVEPICIALQVTSDRVHQHSSYFIITGFIAFAIGVDLMLP